MRTRTLVVLGMVIGLGVASAGAAQQPTLAEIARQEAARRKAIEGGAAKVYTNKDLPKDAQIKAATPGGKEGAGDETASKDGEASKTGDAAVKATGTEKAAGTSAPAPSDDPRVNELQSRLQDVIDTSKVLLTQMDQDALSIVNLFEDSERKVAIAKRDNRMVDYRKIQSQIQALTEQLNEARAEAAKRKNDKEQ